MRQYEISKTYSQCSSCTYVQCLDATNMHFLYVFFGLPTQNRIHHHFPWSTQQASGVLGLPRKTVDDGDGRSPSRGAKRPRRGETPEVSPSDPSDFGAKLFTTLPEWKITENDIKMIRERGLVPDKLRLGRFL